MKEKDSSLGRKMMLNRQDKDRGETLRREMKVYSSKKQQEDDIRRVSFKEGLVFQEQVELMLKTLFDFPGKACGSVRVLYS